MNPLLQALMQAAKVAGRIAADPRVKAASASASLAGQNITWISQGASSIKNMGLAVAGAINPLNLFTAGVHTLAGAATGVARVISPLSYLNVAIDTLAKVSAAAVEHVGAMGNAVRPFVDRANPAYSQMHDYAIGDAAGAIGKTLIPVMKASTAIVRAFADVVFRLSTPL